jgi:hypothetical protein
LSRSSSVVLPEGRGKRPSSLCGKLVKEVRP